MFFEQQIKFLMARNEELRLEAETMMEATNELLKRAEKFA